jgi:hypothetical protein
MLVTDGRERAERTTQRLPMMRSQETSHMSKFAREGELDVAEETASNEKAQS